MIDASVDARAGDPDDIAALARWAAVALNEALIAAGAPFRMIELQLGADGDPGVRYFGDGVIVATPSGSTAYNVSAGGPIISPNIQAICITPTSARTACRFGRLSSPATTPSAFFSAASTKEPCSSATVNAAPSSTTKGIAHSASMSG